MYKPMRLDFNHVDVSEYVEYREVMLSRKSLFHRLGMTDRLYFSTNLTIFLDEICLLTHRVSAQQHDLHHNLPAASVDRMKSVCVGLP